MNTESQLKLQAYVDGELPEHEAQALAATLADDSDAQALVSELSWTRQWLVGNEPELKLPESREFFWSKIEREIARGAAQEEQTPTSAWWPDWRRILSPLAGFATVAVVALAAVRFFDFSPLESGTDHLATVENPSEHMSSFSFRSESENMFVVWIYDKTEQTPTAEPEASMGDM